jgi:hypothetical protein
VHAVLESLLTADMARSGVTVTKNLEKVDELEIAYQSVRLDRRSRPGGRFKVSGWPISHTYKIKAGKG